jgi:uridine kinase
MGARRASQGEAVAAVIRAACPGGPVFVGVDGLEGAGKSRLAARLAAAVPGAVVVSVDEFSGPEVDEWDWQRLHDQLVAPLLDGRRARYESRTWDGSGPGGWRAVEPGGLVVVEGVSCTREEARVPWSLRIWVDAPEEVRRERMLERGDPAMYRHWVQRWAPSAQAYIDAQRPLERADLIVAGDE